LQINLWGTIELPGSQSDQKTTRAYTITTPMP